MIIIRICFYSFSQAMSSVRRVLVLFGSQTGTAEDTAEELATLLRNRHVDVQVSAMDNYLIHNLITERVVVCICSTTGQGDEPDNMKLAWKFLLRRELPSNSLENCLFAVLGLGDSSYQKFNFVAKRLDKRVRQLGAPVLYKLALADEQHELGLDAVVLAWMSGICLEVLNLFPLSPGLEAIPDTSLPPPKFSITTHVVTAARQSIIPSFGYSEYSPFISILKSNTRVTRMDHFQDTRLIILDISSSEIQYSPGDVAMIQPRNSTETVEEFLNMFNLNPKTFLYITPNEHSRQLPPNISSTCTLQDLAYNIDLTCRPRRSFFSLLSKLSQDEMEKERLLEFSSTEGQDDLFDYCYRPRKTLLEVLRDFPKSSAVVPLTYLLDLIPAIKPRAFSIASSPRVHAGEIHLLVARVEYKSKLPKPRLGLCSNWLANLKSADAVPVWTKQGTFRLSDSTTTPLIMVGPGTGVAPFRSIITERSSLGIGDNFLFFGCRFRFKDFYFENEWKYLEDLNLLNLFPAFSRDDVKVTYVQHDILKKKQLVVRLLRENCMVLIAGSAKDMPSSVLIAFREIIKEQETIDDIEAEQYIQLLIRQGRIQLETWS